MSALPEFPAANDSDALETQEWLDALEAVLDRVPYGMLSGWSSWEDGMSDRAQDVTRAVAR